MHQITEEEYSQLHSVIDHPGFKVLVKHLENVLEDQFLNLKREKVDDQNPMKIVYLKSNYEGAEKLLKTFVGQCSTVLKQPGNGVRR